MVSIFSISLSSACTSIHFLTHKTDSRKSRTRRRLKKKNLAHIQHYWQTEVAALCPGIFNPGPVGLHETRLSPLILDNPPCRVVRRPTASFRFSLLRGCIKSLSSFSTFSPQWGATDAEIKVPSDENADLKRSPFKAWSRSVYSHTCYAHYQGFLP